MLGNKGGVAIGFDYLESSLCFVNSHLAAHQIMIKDRNYDVQEIVPPYVWIGLIGTASLSAVDSTDHESEDGPQGGRNHGLSIHLLVR